MDDLSKPSTSTHSEEQGNVGQARSERNSKSPTTLPDPAVRGAESHLERGDLGRASGGNAAGRFSVTQAAAALATQRCPAGLRWPSR